MSDFPKNVLTMFPLIFAKGMVKKVWGKLFLLTVKLLCLQSLKALIRRTFPL